MSDPIGTAPLVVAEFDVAGSGMADASSSAATFPHVCTHTTRPNSDPAMCSQCRGVVVTRAKAAPMPEGDDSFDVAISFPIAAFSGTRRMRPIPTA